MSRVGHGANDTWLGAVVEPAFSSAERRYAEWVIEEASALCNITIGVTDLDAAPPAGQCIFSNLGSRMYYCLDSRVFLGSSACSDLDASGRRSRGDRVGLLVERGSAWVYVNGARLGPGPMATDLPQRVRTGTACTHDSDRRARALALPEFAGPAQAGFSPSSPAD